MSSPLWAPTGSDRIERALDVARLRPGERFVDLGCGDGRVLLAAARRGADVTGIEIDRDRADRARGLLARAGFSPNVVVGDVALAEIAADVVFAFLSPATLQRLAPKLGRLASGTRLVFPEHGVEGWEPDRIQGRCFLYRTPPRLAAAGSPLGWEDAGVLAGLRAGATTLISVRAIPPRGRVSVAGAGGLDGVATVAAGVDVVERPRPVVVDVEWQARPAGTVVAGRLECAGIGACLVYGVYTRRPLGIWGLPDRDACDRVAAQLAAPDRGAESILDAARARGAARF